MSGLANVASDLLKIDRYERRGLSRRKFEFELLVVSAARFSSSFQHQRAVVGHVAAAGKNLLYNYKL